jgi:hypothetical protein
VLLAAVLEACSSEGAERGAANDAVTTPIAGADAPATTSGGAGGMLDAGAGGLSAGQGGGTAQPSTDDEPPEPTGVVFEWPETVPGAAGSCKPGHYVGEFMCRLHIVDTTGEGAFDMAGTIDMQLEQTANGEILRIRDGRFESISAGAIPAWADIVGELECGTARFDARLENGRFSVALGLPIPFTEGTFSGPMVANYDKAAFEMTNGEWNMIGELDGFPGSCMDGWWFAKWVP